MPTPLPLQLLTGIYVSVQVLKYLPQSSAGAVIIEVDIMLHQNSCSVPFLGNAMEPESVLEFYQDCPFFILPH